MSKQSKFQYLIYSLLLALLIGGLIMWATGSNPFAVYAAVLTGSFGSLSGLMSVLAYTTPLILTGLGAVVAFQGGVFNIGGEGQLLVGGLAAVLTGIYVDLPQPLPLLLALIAGFAAGAHSHSDGRQEFSCAVRRNSHDEQHWLQLYRVSG